MSTAKRNKKDELHANAFRDAYIAYCCILEEDTFSIRENDELGDAFKNLFDLHFKIKEIDEGIRDSFHLEVLRYLSYIAAQPDYRKSLDECGVSEIPRYKSCTLDYYNREARKIRHRLKKDGDGDTYRERYANKYWWINFSTLIDATNKGDIITANAAFQELSANTHQQGLFPSLSNM